MDFYTLLDQVIDLLRQRQRVSYRALKRQFQLDDAYLEDLKVELIRIQQLAVDQEGEMLVWTGGTSSAPTTASLVLCHFEIIGYSLRSFTRASSVVNCQ